MSQERNANKRNGVGCFNFHAVGPNTFGNNFQTSPHKWRRNTHTIVTLTKHSDGIMQNNLSFLPNLERFVENIPQGIITGDVSKNRFHS